MGKRRVDPTYPRRRRAGLFANVRLAGAAVLPAGAALGALGCGRPVVVPLAILGGPAVVAILLAIVAVIQRRIEKPHRVWQKHPWLALAVDAVALGAASAAATCVVGPWQPRFHDGPRTMAAMYGFAIAGGLAALLFGLALLAQAPHDDGLFRKSEKRPRGWLPVILVMMIALIGPMAGWVVGIPMYFVWTVEAPWVVLYAALAGMATVVVWALFAVIRVRLAAAEKQAWLDARYRR